MDIEISSSSVPMVEQALSMLIIPQSFEHQAHRVNSSIIHIFVKASIPDPDHTGRRKKSPPMNMAVQPDMSIESLIKKFTETKSDYAGHDYYLKYNHKLYKNGKISEVGIRNHQTCELISLESEQSATENEGFIFAFWSLVPLMAAISFLVPAFTGTFDSIYRGIFMLFGTLIGLPASILLIIGVSELYSDKIRVSFVNNDWFGPCCGCCCGSGGGCCCGNVSNEEEELLKNDEEFMKNDEELDIGFGLNNQLPELEL